MVSTDLPALEQQTEEPVDTVVTVTGHRTWYEHALSRALRDAGVPEQAVTFTDRIDRKAEPKARLRVLTIPTQGTSQGGRYALDIIEGMFDLFRELEVGGPITVALALDIHPSVPDKIAGQIRDEFIEAARQNPDLRDNLLLDMKTAQEWVITQVQNVLGLDPPDSSDGEATD